MYMLYLSLYSTVSALRDAIGEFVGLVHFSDHINRHWSGRGLFLPSLARTLRYVFVFACCSV